MHIKISFLLLVTFGISTHGSSVPSTLVGQLSALEEQQMITRTMVVTLMREFGDLKDAMGLLEADNVQLVQEIAKLKETCCNQTHAHPDCVQLSAPGNGTIDRCGHHVGATCHFSCSYGYIMTSGDSERVCQINGRWDGRPARCQACPKDTYKKTAGSCQACPANSQTWSGAQNQLADCICKMGYQGPYGGPCQARTQCQNLTQVDAPANGGLVCHRDHQRAAHHCKVLCNAGYEFVTRPNQWEICDRSTRKTWSFQAVDSNARIQPCVEEFFEGIQIEHESLYFVRHCQDLGAAEQQAVKRQFAQQLSQNHRCEGQGCQSSDMTIICG